MSMPHESGASRAGWPWLIAVAMTVAVVLGAIALVLSAEKAARRDYEKKQAERRAEYVEKVKAGDDGSGIFVFADPRLIEMLASDPKCVENMTTLNLSMTDLTTPETASAERLVNVRTISIYDCSGVENLLAAMKESAAVEELSFEAVLLPDDAIRLLASFPNLKQVHFAYLHRPSQARLLRETLPDVELTIDEVGPARTLSNDHHGG